MPKYLGETKQHERLRSGLLLMSALELHAARCSWEGQPCADLKGVPTQGEIERGRGADVPRQLI